MLREWDLVEIGQIIKVAHHLSHEDFGVESIVFKTTHLEGDHLQDRSSFLTVLQNFLQATRKKWRGEHLCECESIETAWEITIMECARKHWITQNKPQRLRLLHDLCCLRRRSLLPGFPAASGLLRRNLTPRQNVARNQVANRELPQRKRRRAADRLQAQQGRQSCARTRPNLLVLEIANRG